MVIKDPLNNPMKAAMQKMTIPEFKPASGPGQVLKSAIQDFKAVSQPGSMKTVVQDARPGNKPKQVADSVILQPVSGWQPAKPVFMTEPTSLGIMGKEVATPGMSAGNLVMAPVARATLGPVLSNPDAKLVLSEELLKTSARLPTQKPNLTIPMTGIVTIKKV